jgi:nitrogen regulatory protein PII
MSYLIVLIVDDSHHYLSVLEDWEKVGISSVAIHALTQLGRSEHRGLRDDIPLIPSLQHFLTGNERHGYLLLATTDKQELVEKMVASAEQVVGNPEQPGEGHLFVVPLSQALRWTKHQTGKVGKRKIFGLFALLPTLSAMDLLGTVTNLLSNQP